MKSFFNFILFLLCGIFGLLKFRRIQDSFSMGMWVGETIVFLCEILSGGGYIQLFKQGRKIEVDKVFFIHY